MTGLRFGLTGLVIRCMWACSGVRPPFFKLQGAQATPACDDFRAPLAIGQARDGLDQASGPKACREFFNLGLRHLLAGIEGGKGEHSQREAGFAGGDGVDLSHLWLSKLAVSLAVASVKIGRSGKGGKRSAPLSCRTASRRGQEGVPST